MKSVEKENICQRCVGSMNFSSWIEKNGIAGKCSFDQEHTSAKVVSVKKFAKAVDRYFRERYQPGEQYTDFDWKEEEPFDAQYGEEYSEILRNDLECDEDILTAITNNLPDCSDREIQQGAEPFYNPWTSYEEKSEAAKRALKEEMDYYDIVAALNAEHPIMDLNQNLKSLIDLLEQTKPETSLHHFQLKMIFTFAITSMEAYLSSVFIKTTLGSDEFKDAYLKSQFKDQKVQFGDIYKTYRNIDQIIKESLHKISFHDMVKVKSLFKNVLRIEIGEIEELIKLTHKRHDFVHRNGKSVDDKKITTNKAEILGLIDRIKQLGADINKQIKRLPTDLI